MLNHTLRYARVAGLMSEVPKGTLLEVGSGGRGVNGYLPADWHITACDVSFNDYGAKGLPLPEGLLEHLDHGLRRLSDLVAGALDHDTVQI